MKKEELLKYWVENSDSDFKAMIHLYEKGDYPWSLFIGHLVLEKLLKAYFSQNMTTTPPYTHDLVRIAEKSSLPCNEVQKDLLDTISTFNLRARYDDYKMEFHQKCTKEFTTEWIDIIKELRIWIKKELTR
jgi:HEPN domain-containing protein